MSRDWTPRETYEVEKYHLEQDGVLPWDFMKSVTMTLDGVTTRLYSDEEIALRQQFPVFGKYLEEFPVLYRELSRFDGGLAFLHELDDALTEYIKTGKGDRQSYPVRWFEGELDESFYYRERNNSLLIGSILEEAGKRLSTWVLTDPDCLQFRRLTDPWEFCSYEFLQIDEFADPIPGPRYILAAGKLDLSDYSYAEKKSVLQSYGYENMKELAAAAGSQTEALGLLAEMLFESNSASFYEKELDCWNSAVAEAERRTGQKLDWLYEKGSLSEKIQSAQQQGRAAAGAEKAQPEQDLSH